MTDMKGMGRGTAGGHYPEEHLYKKAPKRPRGAQGMTQTRGSRVQPNVSHPPKAGKKVHGKALVMALKGVANRKHAHDGSK
jgi:hypothetical protein